MKKIYLTMLTAVMALGMNAQTTTSLDFSDVAYLVAATDLNIHPDWAAQGGWTYDSANQQVVSAANWQKAFLADNKISAADGEIASISIQFKLGDGTQALTGDGTVFSLGFTTAPYAGWPSGPGGWEDRNIVTVNIRDGEVELGTQGHTAGGSEQPTGFEEFPYVDAADASAGFELAIDIAVGSDGASTQTFASIKNLATGEKSRSSSMIVTTDFYNDITSGGVNMWFWTQGFMNASASIQQYSVFGLSYGNEALNVESTDAIDFSVSPNPASDVLNVSGVDSVDVIDLLGNTVISGAGSSVDVSGLASGVYIVKGTSANGSGTKKFIKN